MKYSFLFILMISSLICHSQQLVTIEDSSLKKALSDYIETECEAISKKTGCLNIKFESSHVEIWYQCDEHIVLKNPPIYYAIMENYPILFYDARIIANVERIDRKFRNIMYLNFFYGVYEKVKWKVILDENSYKLIERTVFY